MRNLNAEESILLNHAMRQYVPLRETNVEIGKNEGICYLMPEGVNVLDAIYVLVVDLRDKIRIYCLEMGHKGVFFLCFWAFEDGDRIHCNCGSREYMSQDEFIAEINAHQNFASNIDW
jgi:hypothetical protein